MNKSFRGLLADGEKDTIRLSTNNGLTGYKIVKFTIISELPGTTSYESVVKLFTLDPAAVTQNIDFDDSSLLAVAYIENRSPVDHAATEAIRVINDNTIFNQDIFITHFDAHSSTNCNYYLELEQIRLDLNEATVATLKDMRGSE